MNGIVRLKVKSQPLVRGWTEKEAPVGGTLLDYIKDYVPEDMFPLARIVVGEAEKAFIVPQEKWHIVRPKSNIRVMITVTAFGGGGSGGGGKNAFRIIGTIALLAAVSVVSGGIGTAPAVVGALGSTGAAIAGAAAGAAVGVVGGMILNQLVPPPTTDLGGLSGQGGSASPTLSGAGNALRPWSVVPRLMGRYRMYPPLGAPTYTEVVGGHTYLRMLLDFGHGPILFEEEGKIGETPLSQFTGVEEETRTWETGSQGVISLYPGTVTPDLNISLKLGTDWVERMMPAEGDEVSVDISYPEGMYDVSHSSGKRSRSRSTTFIQIFDPDLAVWKPATTIDTHTNRQDPFSVGGGFKMENVGLARGLYNLRFRTVTEQSGGTQDFNATYITGLRAILHEDPLLLEGQVETGLRIRATSQLNGTIQTFNRVGTAYAVSWDGATWASRPTRQPAAWFRDVLQGPASPLSVSDSDIDLDALQEWAEFTDSRGWHFDAYIDSAWSVEDLLRAICAAGRARYVVRDGKFSVALDIEQTMPMAMLTPKNTSKFRGRRSFWEAPHALRVRFRDEEQGWKQTEIIVYRDGYTKANAVVYETFEVFGVSKVQQNFELARYHLAVLTNRPEKYSVEMFMEGIIPEVGNLVTLQHDVAEFGTGSSFVKSLITDNGNTIGLVLESTVEIPSTNPVIRVRYTATNEQEDFNLVYIEPESNTLTLDSPVGISEGPQVGDLVSIGEFGLEVRECLVQSIEQSEGWALTFNLVDYAPEVLNAEGPIPDYSSGTPPDEDSTSKPPEPRVEQVITDERALYEGNDGTLLPRIFMLLASPGPLGGRIEVETYLFGTDDTVSPNIEIDPDEQPFFTKALDISAEIRDVYVPDVIDGSYYAVRLRFVNRVGIPSNWVGVDGQEGYSTIYVVGKTNPPPEILNFTVEELESGERRYSWEVPFKPKDLRGYQIRFSAQPGSLEPEWDDMVPLHDGYLISSPYDIVLPVAGSYWISIRSEDTGGRTNTPFTIAAVLGEPGVDTGYIIPNAISRFAYVESNTHFAFGTGSSYTLTVDYTVEAVASEQMLRVDFFIDFGTYSYTYGDYDNNIDWNARMYVRVDDLTAGTTVFSYNFMILSISDRWLGAEQGRVSRETGTPAQYYLYFLQDPEPGHTYRFYLGQGRNTDGQLTSQSTTVDAQRILVTGFRR